MATGVWKVSGCVLERGGPGLKALSKPFLLFVFQNQNAKDRLKDFPLPGKIY